MFLSPDAPTRAYWFGRAAADQSHRPVGVGLRVLLDRVGAPFFPREPVLQRERGDAEARQVFRRLEALGLEHQQTMAASRHHDDGGAGGLLRRRKVDRD